jgi:hypothetical protein
MIKDQNVRRAYRYLQGNRDDQMAMAPITFLVKD